MIVFIPSIVVISAFFVSMYGWGRLAVKLLYGETLNCWAYSVALGLAFWILMGGVLNAMQLAYPVTLYIIFGLGVALSLAFAFLSLREVRLLQLTLPDLQSEMFQLLSRTNLLSYVLPLFLTLLALGFLVATLLPGNVFNYHDDFHTYFVRPVRMLQTGTLGGDPFDVLGLDSLGAQAFLQSFMVASFPIAYINGFDAIFCFALYAFLLIEIARKLEIHWLYTISSLLVFATINPQYVNVSALYSGSVMILALIYASCLLAKSYGNSKLKRSFLVAIPGALFLSSLISLKVTFVAYAVIYFFAYFSLSILWTGDKRQAATVGAFSGIVAIVATVPWLVLHLPNYVQFVGLATAGPADGANAASFFARLSSTNFNGLSSLFSVDKLFWGGSYLDYNFVVALLGVAFVVALYLLKNKQIEIEKHHLIPILSSCAAGIASYFVTAYVFSSQTAVRYSCPVLIASLPAALLLLGKHALRYQSVAQAPAGGLSSISRLGIALLVSQSILIALFSDVFVDRTKRAYNTGTLVSFPTTDAYVRYNKAALSDEARRWALSLQSKTDKGETILTWMSVPFHLDFARNRILTVMEPGLLNPWLDIPFDESPEMLVKYLRQLSVRYVMWEYKGPGMKSARRLLAQYPASSRIVKNHIYFRKALNFLAKRSKILHYNERIVVIDIGKG